MEEKIVKQNDKNRILFVDATKGIAMLLVIFAHTLTGEGTSALFRGIVYSFHMPLFFILSGYTMKHSTDFNGFIKKKLVLAKKLLLPGVLLFFAWVIIEVIRGYGSFSDTSYLKGKLITLLFASANSRECYGMFINGIGMIWFFFVLYGGRNLYDFLAMIVLSFKSHKKGLPINGKVSDVEDRYIAINYIILGVLSTIITIAGMVIGQNYWLPFSFDISMGMVLFFFLGDLMKKITNKFASRNKDRNILKKVILFVLSVFVWAVLLYITYPSLADWTYLEVGLRRYSVFPLSYICAFAGTYALCQLCNLIEQFSVKETPVGQRFLKPFVFIGKNSMTLLCVHIMDQLLDFIWYYEANQYITFFRRVVIDLMIFVIIVLILDKVSKKYKKN